MSLEPAPRDSRGGGGTRRGKGREVLLRRLVEADREKGGRGVSLGGGTGNGGSRAEEHRPRVGAPRDHDPVVRVLARSEVPLDEGGKKPVPHVIEVEGDEGEAGQARERHAGPSGRRGLEGQDRCDEGRYLVVEEVRRPMERRESGGARGTGARRRVGRAGRRREGERDLVDSLPERGERVGPRSRLKAGGGRVEALQGLPRGVDQPDVLDERGVGGETSPARVPVCVRRPIVRADGPGVDVQPQESARHLPVEVARELLGSRAGSRAEPRLVGLADLPQPPVLEGGEHDEEDGESDGAEQERARDPGARQRPHPHESSTRPAGSSLPGQVLHALNNLFSAP